MLQENYTCIIIIYVHVITVYAYNHSTATFSNWFENILMLSDSITEGGNLFQSTIVLGLNEC